MLVIQYLIRVSAGPEQRSHVKDILKSDASGKFGFLAGYRAVLVRCKRLLSIPLPAGT